MKIKQGFTLRNVANTNIIVPVSPETMNYKNMFSLNEPGALLWRELEHGAEKEDLLRVLRSEYEVEELTALRDVEEFLEKLRSFGALEE